MLISPATTTDGAPRHLLTRDQIHTSSAVLSCRGTTGSLLAVFLEFAAGYRDYRCSPWSTVTFTPRGWKGPCYLIGQKFTFSWDEFWTGTDWDYWESRRDERCQNCAMHSGFEASAVREAGRNPRDLGRLVAWNLFG
jgi:hypothetical protein